MNQILYTGNGKKKNKGPAPLKTILIFFSIAILILGLIFIGKNSYSLYSDYVANSTKESTPPEVTFEQENNKAVITISQEDGVSKVKYNWNEDEETILQGNNEQTVIIDDIDIPSGTNTLYVTVIDVNNTSTSFSYEYSYDGIAIELAVVNNSDIKITATDLSGIAYISYKWNSDEEIIAYPDEEGATSIEQTTTIPAGYNTLTVTAVNSSNYSVTKTQDVKGVYPPEISLYIDSGVLYVTVTDEEGIDEIVQQVNDEAEVVYDAAGETTYSYTYEIGDNQILITITATNSEGVSSTFTGKNY